MKYLSFALVLMLAVGGLNSFGQSTAEVTWSFDVTDVGPFEKDLHLKASIAPGWHIYSQFLPEGGPIPTRIQYEEAKTLRTVGQARETGEQIKYYDELFEMEITCYAKEVIFSQRISPPQPVSTIRGQLTYMVCNSNQCIPCHETFSIRVKP